MTKQLLESKYLTVNLGTFLDKHKSIDDENKAEASATLEKETIFEKKPADFDWLTELINRINQNRRLEPKNQKKEYEIENLFWKDYFNNNWDPEIAKKLFNIGSLLRKAIITIGFDPKRNPILNFINLQYVQENLISTSLLNIETFKAIYTALAKKQIALKEFFKASDYNIIYCRDLYSKTSADMGKYLSEQSKILSFDKNSYTVEEQKANIKKFLQPGPGSDSVRNAEAELRILSEINAKYAKANKEDTDAALEASKEALESFTDKLKTNDEIATILLLADTVKPGISKEILKKLNHSGKESVRIDQITEINQRLQQAKIKITTKNVDYLINLLLKRLQQMGSID
jgi:hypothetical protein